MTILNYASGDLKGIINELEVSELTSDQSGDITFKHVQAAYREYTEKKLPQAIEQAIFDKDTPRRKGEGMLQYCTRREQLFKKLKKEGCDLPDTAKGYIY